jgi:exodeoxyribonuclease VII large subunit
MSDLFTTDIITPVSQTAQTIGESEFLNLNAKSKELQSQVDWVITHRKTEYLAELVALQHHKSVAIRRKIATGIGKIGNSSNIEDIQNWLNNEPDRETLLTLEVTLDQLKRRSGTVQNDNKILSVSEALNTIKKTVSEKEYTIEGELAEINLYGAMYYFALKDAEDTRINCTIFSGKALNFGFPLNEGWAVQVVGKFKISKTGKLQLDIQSMKLTGEGELKRNLEILQKKLDSEGLFDPARKRILNSLPQNILLLASPASAAMQDFQKVLLSRRKGINIYYLPIKTQGVGAEFEILNRLESANEFCQKYDIDTVILTRGGGSKDDLMVFNSEKIVRAIYALHKPTIVAIGHERDTCLSELVADCRASTPSNAAELCSLSENEILSELQNINTKLQNYFLERQYSYLNFTNTLYQQIILNIKTQIESVKSLCIKTEQIIFYTIHSAKSSLQRDFNNLLNNVQDQIYRQKSSLPTAQNLTNQIHNRIQFTRQNLSQNQTLLTQNLSLQIQSYHQEINTLTLQIELNNPQKILKKGYAILKQNNKPLHNLSSFDPNSKLTIQMQDGEKVV